jgi:hypothetical protein
MKMSKMKTFRVIVEQVGTAVVEVKAEDEFEAEDIAMDKWGNGEYDGYMMHDISITVDI